MRPLKIIVCGARGRMGRSIVDLAKEDDRFQVSAGVVHNHDESSLTDFPLLSPAEFTKHLKQADVIVDFSTPQSSVLFAEAAAGAKKPIVIGTTGFDAAQLAKIKECAKRTAIFLSPNFSPGMNLLFHFAERAAAALPNYDAGIHEVHHTNKKDSPSGSALRIAEAVERGNGRKVSIVSERLGTAIGDHTLVFAGSEERLELTHHAQSRDIFAKGALEAALWVSKKAPGLYDMRKMLNLQ
jgi:4-hydroxy-tetrahydrodipicolinate reductase